MPKSGYGSMPVTLGGHRRIRSPKSSLASWRSVWGTAELSVLQKENRARKRWLSYFTHEADISLLTINYSDGSGKTTYISNVLVLSLFTLLILVSVISLDAIFVRKLSW